jgi:hypothetical protein
MEGVQEESVAHWETIPWFELHLYNKIYLYSLLNCYGANGEVSFKGRELLYID